MEDDEKCEGCKNDVCCQPGMTNQEMRDKYDLFERWTKAVYPETTEKQCTQILCHAIRIFWRLEDEAREPLCEE